MFTVDIISAIHTSNVLDKDRLASHYISTQNTLLPPSKCYELTTLLSVPQCKHHHGLAITNTDVQTPAIPLLKIYVLTALPANSNKKADQMQT